MSQAQTIHHSIRSNNYGSNVYSKNFTHAFSFVSNPAALGVSVFTTAGVSVVRKYQLRELSVFNAAASGTIPIGAFGISLQHAGSSDFSETAIGAAYGRSLGKIAIGLQFNYTRVHVVGPGSGNALYADFGGFWELTEKLFTGICIKNLVGGNLRKLTTEKLPTIISSGLGYELSAAVLLVIEIIKEEDRPTELLGYFNYTIQRKFHLRAGVSSINNMPWLMAGLSWKKYRVDITNSYHPQLGITSGIQLFIIQQKQKK